MKPWSSLKLSKAIVAGMALVTLSGLSPVPASAQDQSFPILFTNVHVFDGVSETRIENANVLVVDNLIAEVSAEPLAAANARIIDGGGRTLMPGLIDAHVHMAITEPLADLRDNYDWMYWGAVSTIEAEKMLLRGFTTVRDAGGPAIGLQKAIDRGKAVGPRIFPSGPVISQTSGHGEHRNYTEPHPNFMGAQPSFFNQHVEFLADGVPEVLRATREALRMGATQIKVMAGGGVSSSVDPLHTVQGLPEELGSLGPGSGGLGHLCHGSRLQRCFHSEIDRGRRDQHRARPVDDGKVCESDQGRGRLDRAVLFPAGP